MKIKFYLLMVLLLIGSTEIAKEKVSLENDDVLLNASSEIRGRMVRIM